MNAGEKNSQPDRDAKTGQFIGTGMYDWQYLLTDPTCKDWLAHLAPNTQKSYGYRLNKFMDGALGSRDPSVIVGWSMDTVKAKIREFVRPLMEIGHDDEAKQIGKAVKYLYEFYHEGVTIKWRRGEFDSPKSILRAKYEVVPDNPSVYRIASGNVRRRAIIMCLWCTGVRVNCLCRWTVGMVWEAIYPTIKAPLMLRITDDMDTKLKRFKIGYYYTFLAKPALEVLKDWLDFRQKQGWFANMDDPLFVKRKANGNGTGFEERYGNEQLEPPEVWETVKFALKAAGFDPKKTWVHSFRRAFMKVLRRAGVELDLREAMHGHRVPGVRGNYWDYNDPEPARIAYGQCDWSPSGTPTLERIEEENQRLKEELEEVKRRLDQSNHRRDVSFDEQLEDFLGSEKGKRLLRRLGLAA